jgi:hypothetical protein
MATFRRGLKSTLIPLINKPLLHKRAVIETSGAPVQHDRSDRAYLPSRRFQFYGKRDPLSCGLRNPPPDEIVHT